ncbi:helix-hairpin-helix domain-containing protein [Arthrobacter sp. I2-34]|uniref:Helix-hairpin-helix domain-containing protein n=1 Tax=Arthrobacter hankyongi TaxID=2904801 RepID=A0ABS9L6E7_9MICC|nr:ComEA family DNA-binding protein [Arthrobacter hankyongi]MCG2622242.1 helix-hairpin-helix domain-containing protein [Arthrobacter hankyongi]
MARHRWAAGPDASSSDPSANHGDGSGLPVPRPARIRFRIAAGAAVVVAGAALGTGIARVAGADLDRDVAQVVASVPLASDGAAPNQADRSFPATPPEQASRQVSTPAAGGSGPQPPGTAPPGASAAAMLVVHVAGAVARPGIVRLPAGARVFEALAAAGGATKNADDSALNLAAPVADGQQIFVPAPGQPPPGPQQAVPGGSGPPADGQVPPPGAGTPAAAKININTAGAEELTSLPGIGPVLAGRIVDFRQQHGAFASPADLDAVPGIGPGLLDGLLDLVTV